MDRLDPGFAAAAHRWRVGSFKFTFCIVGFSFYSRSVLARPSLADGQNTGQESRIAMQHPFYQYKRRGLLLVISAPSGGGKSAVLQRLLAAEPELAYSVSVTSRPPRAGEVEGKDYFFVSRQRLETMIAQGVFYEWAEVHGNLYGTRQDTIQRALEAGKDVALDIDVQGGMDVKWQSPDAALVFLMPPSFKKLEERLRGRGTDNEEAIQRRLANARHEMQFWRQYDYVVINEDLETAVAEVLQILSAERLRTRHLVKTG
jgi:guanylate kinase